MFMNADWIRFHSSLFTIGPQSCLFSGRYKVNRIFMYSFYTSDTSRFKSSTKSPKKMMIIVDGWPRRGLVRNWSEFHSFTQNRKKNRSHRSVSEQQQKQQYTNQQQHTEKPHLTSPLLYSVNVNCEHIEMLHTRYRCTALRKRYKTRGYIQCCHTKA